MLRCKMFIMSYRWWIFLFYHNLSINWQMVSKNGIKRTSIASTNK
jgi:hypothetical protein